MVYNEKVKAAIYKYRAKDPERWSQHYKTYRTAYREAHHAEYNESQRILMNKRYLWLKISKEFRRILIEE